MSLSEQNIEQQLRSKGKSAPRITAEHVDASIVGRQVTLIPNTMITVAVLTLYNGFTVTGVNNGPVDPENFDAEIGAGLAISAARDQIWLLEGYLLADRLYRAKGGAALPHYGTDIDPAEAMAFGTAVELLKSKGYAYDEARGQWLRGDEDLQPGPAPTHVTVTDGEGNSATHELAKRVIMGADYSSEPDRSVAVTADGTVIEQIDGSADIVREPVSADGHSTSEGFTPLTVEQMAYFAGNTTKAPEAPHGRHLDGTPITVVTDEQQAAITAADTTEATEGGQFATGPSEPQG